MNMRRLPPSLPQIIAAEIAQAVSKQQGKRAVHLIRMLVNESGPGKFLALSPHELEVIFAKRGLSDGTKRRYTRTLWWVYEIAIHLNLIRKNPAADILLPKDAPSHPDFSVDRAVVDTVIAHSWSALRLHGTRHSAFETLLDLAVVYVASSGAFPSEMPALRCCDLLFDGLIIGRGFRKRKLFLSHDALTALRNYRTVREAGTQSRSDALLFVTALGKPTSPNSIWMRLQRVIRAAGVAELGLTPGKLARSSVKLIADSGLDWLDAFSIHGYRSIPNLELEPYTTDELAKFVDQLHPMSSERKTCK